MTEDSILQSLADSNRQTEARATLRGLLDSAPTTMAYMTWRRRLPPVETSRRVAILASYTIETIEPFLDVEAYLSGWRPVPTFIQYEQWRSALFNGAMFDEIEPEAVVVLVHAEELFPRVPTSANNTLDLLETALHAFRSKRSTPLFLGLVADPPMLHERGLGLGSARDRVATVTRANTRVLKLAAEIPDVHILDVPAWAAAYGAGWYDRRSYLNNASLVSHKAMPALARGLARTIGCLFRTRRKLLAVDLDNTLWGGIVGEDGVDGLALAETWPGPAYVEFQEFLRDLRASGVLLAVVSKNELADALAVFNAREEMVLGWNDFSACRVNWSNKVENLVQIAEELKIGLDAIVFADDSALECASVRETLPMVEVVELGNEPSQFAEKILRSQSFDTISVSREDAIRADGYKAEQKRQDLRETHKDFDSFLSGINLRVEIRSVDGQTAPRAHQLLGRTNQFNISLERPTLEEVVGRIDHGAGLYQVSLSDRFGEYGIIAVVELRAGSRGVAISNLAISCRALGRRVEDGLLAFCCDQAVQSGASVLSAHYRKGPRNDQVRALLERHGFSVVDTNDSMIDFEINLLQGRIDWPRHIGVDLPARAGERAS